MTISFRALADPQRLEIIELLWEGGEQPVATLVAGLPIAQSGVSRHLRILRESGFVQVRADGQKRLYSLRPEPFEELDQWLRRYRKLWESRMDAFGEELQRRQSPTLSDD